ncbi:hypothetical protein KDA23_05105 [Candidatus Saccharibacteria bacterium]|nr:hypothetical protein [Candidatus Saccharibacteria bacterium]
MSTKVQLGMSIRFIVIGITVTMILTSFWWTQAYQSPQRAFRDMLVNNLTTTSVTKSELSSNDTRNILQHVTISLGAVSAARWLVTLQSGNTSVTTESIGTPSSGYLRYLEIQDTNKSHNYAPIINVWSKGDSNTSLGLLFSQALLDVNSAPVPPIGNPSKEIRDEILDYIDSEAVFTPDYSNVKTGTVNGRKVYALNVEVKLAPYLRMMQAFAEAYGLSALQDIDPTQYQAVPAAKVSIAIDKLSHTMVRVQYSAANFVETYSDYGLTQPLTVPTAQLKVSELQKRFDSIQQ